MKIVYTKHAEEMLVFRRINKNLVDKCLKYPDKILPAKLEKLTYLKDYGKNYLKAIVTKEKNQVIVITVYWLAKKRARM